MPTDISFKVEIEIVLEISQTLSCLKSQNVQIRFQNLTVNDVEYQN